MGLIGAILRKVKDDPTRLDVFSPNRLKRRPLEMPNHIIKPRSRSRRRPSAPAFAALSGVHDAGRGESSVSPSERAGGAMSEQPSTNLSNME